jgi:hypothetical protein
MYALRGHLGMEGAVRCVWCQQRCPFSPAHRRQQVLFCAGFVTPSCADGRFRSRNKGILAQCFGRRGGTCEFATLLVWSAPVSEPKDSCLPKENQWSEWRLIASIRSVSVCPLKAVDIPKNTASIARLTLRRPRTVASSREFSEHFFFTMAGGSTKAAKPVANLTPRMPI